MRMMRHAVAAAALLLGACAFTEPYPMAWDSVQPRRQDCRHLEGQYRDDGERPGAQARASLTHVLFGSGGAQATRVSLSLPRRDAMEVVVWAHSTPSSTRTLSAERGEFACENGVLAVHRGSWVNEGQGHGRESFRIELSAAGDWLIARMEESFVGMAVVVPVVARQTRWYRFARLRE